MMKVKLRGSPLELNLIKFAICYTLYKQTSNEKRKESCRKVGSHVKHIGHRREIEFLERYNPTRVNDPISYGATSDTTMDIEHPVYKKLQDVLSVKGPNVSNKSSNNIQLVLGNIPELLNVSMESLTETFNKNLFNKYLKKCDSDTPVDILAYRDVKNPRWIFFNVDDVVNFISTKCNWRKLKSGRMKGDFENGSSKGCGQYLTYERRSTHNSHFLGFNGNKGKVFIDLLMDPIHGIRHYIDGHDMIKIS